MASSSENASSVLFNFESGSNVVNFDEDFEHDSDGTLVGDEFEEQFVRPTSDVIVIRDETPQDPNDSSHLDTYSSGGRTYRPGKTVELADGDFLRITAIINESHSSPVYLKGIVFRRNKILDGLMELKRNEVTMMLTFNNDDPRDIYHQSIEAVQLRDVVKFRELIKTNQPFPRSSFRESDDNWRSQGRDYIIQHGRLICRTKMIDERKEGGSMLFLEQTEADSGFGMVQEDLRSDFRGETIKGGTCPKWYDGELAFDRNEKVRSRNIDPLQFYRRKVSLQSQEAVEDAVHGGFETGSRRYTFGDAFGGPGGASRGAKAAGLRNEWAFDFDPAAIDTYQRNFFRTRCETIAAHEFVTVIDEDFQVDVLHLSPPCQTFSPYHVHQGKNDELNQATFFAIEELLKKVKPRIVTLEETFGLSRMLKHQDWLNAMIQIFTKLGFSIRWRVFNLCDFGLPQPRKRLFVVASCPGEPLPTFPAPTHCKAADLHRNPHLSRFATVEDAIAHIPNGFSLHHPDQMPPINKPPYPANLPLRRTICCSGNQDYHPSGKRNFTLRELACLQGFPLEHEFGPQRTRIQIGNAVPPIVAKVFFNHIREHLLKVDGLA